MTSERTAPRPCPIRRRDSGGQREQRGEINGQKTIETQEVQPRSQQDRGERHAPAEARHATSREARQGRQGQEPEAGHRDRVVRGAAEGKEGATEKAAEVIREARCFSKSRIKALAAADPAEV